MYNNPILQGLKSNNANPQMAQLKQMVQMYKNPMLGFNPEMQQVISYVKEHGNNPKEAFYALAKEKGVDPQTVLS